MVGPKSCFPLGAERSYTSQDAPVDALAAMLSRLCLARVVLVQPSFYGFDNACKLAAVAQLHDACGVAVLPAWVEPAKLDTLNARGIRGLRVNIATTGHTSVENMRIRVEAAAHLCQRHGWHVERFLPAEAIEPLAPLLSAWPVETVIDHFGLANPDAVDGALAALIGLLAGGKAWVKISGAYRIADDPEDRRKGLPFQDIDTRVLLHLLPRWLEDVRLVQRC